MKITKAVVLGIDTGSAPVVAQVSPVVIAAGKESAMVALAGAMSSALDALGVQGSAPSGSSGAVIAMLVDVVGPVVANNVLSAVPPPGTWQVL